MYIRSIHVQNVKLLRDVHLEFPDASDGEPRKWTMLVGENRLCKTTLLQAIAAAASGQDRANQLVNVASFPDRRRPADAAIDASFTFSRRRHEAREYPGLLNKGAAPPVLHTQLRIFSGFTAFRGTSLYEGGVPEEKAVREVFEFDPLAESRARAIKDWFVAGYGVNRTIAASTKALRPDDPTLSRLSPLFGESLIGTGFVDYLPEGEGKAFAAVLKSILIGTGLLPHIKDLELRGRGGIRSTADLMEAQRFQMEVGSESIKIPATWLSQGYQALITWLSDLVGQIFLESGTAVPSSEMEGLVLIDEIDLHLHPRWQQHLVGALKRVFPKIQFVATTHSPMVLPELDREELFLMKQDAEGNVSVEPANTSPALLTSSELYAQIFEVKRQYPEQMREALDRYASLAGDPLRTDEDEEEMKGLLAKLFQAGIEIGWEATPRDSER